MTDTRQPVRPGYAARIFASVRRIVLVCLVVYGLACLLVAFEQRKLIYYPTTIAPARVDAMARSAGLERWRTPAGDIVGMKRLALRQPAAGQILVTYGNGGTAVGVSHYADDIQQQTNFDVFILEYPGYEDRPGKPTERHLFAAADTALQLLATNRPLYIVGESLGTGVAAYLAGTHPNIISGIVLIAPYEQLAGPAQQRFPWLPVRLLLADRFESGRYLRQYHGPVGVLVGGADQVVPETNGYRLYNSYSGPKQLWRFPQDDHGDLFSRLPAIWSQLIALWQPAK
jgi:uncharacterized protein